MTPLFRHLGAITVHRPHHRKTTVAPSWLQVRARNVDIIRWAIIQRCSDCSCTLKPFLLDDAFHHASGQLGDTALGRHRIRQYNELFLDSLVQR